MSLQQVNLCSLRNKPAYIMPLTSHRTWYIYEAQGTNLDTFWLYNECHLVYTGPASTVLCCRWLIDLLLGLVHRASNWPINKITRNNTTGCSIDNWATRAATLSTNTAIKCPLRLTQSDHWTGTLLCHSW